MGLIALVIEVAHLHPTAFILQQHQSQCKWVHSTRNGSPALIFYNYGIIWSNQFRRRICVKLIASVCFRFSSIVLAENTYSTKLHKKLNKLFAINVTVVWEKFQRFFRLLFFSQILLSVFFRDQQTNEYTRDCISFYVNMGNIYFTCLRPPPFTFFLSLYGKLLWKVFSKRIDRL